MKTLIPFLVIVLLGLVACNDDCDLADNCLLVPEFAICQTLVVKYYYNQETKECKAYNWCGEPAPFETRDECETCICHD